MTSNDNPVPSALPTESLGDGSGPSPKRIGASPSNNNQALIDDVRALIQFLEERPDFPKFREQQTTFSFYELTKEELIASARRLGHATKRDNKQYFYFDRDFGKNFRISFFTNRSLVCRKVTVKKLVEVEEWECPDSVLADVPQELQEKL